MTSHHAHRCKDLQLISIHEDDPTKTALSTILRIIEGKVVVANMGIER
jgi:hypothetical protein